MIRDSIRIFCKIIRAGGIFILGASVCVIASAYYTFVPIFCVLKLVAWFLSIPIWGRIISLVFSIGIFIFGGIMVAQLFRKFKRWWEGLNTDIALSSDSNDVDYESEQDRNMRTHFESSTFSIREQTIDDDIVEIIGKKKDVVAPIEVLQKRKLMI